MKPLLRLFLFAIAVVLLAGGCTPHNSDYQSTKYPRTPAVNQDRKTGPAMLLYEAAEKDADPNNIIVIPPSDKKKKAD